MSGDREWIGRRLTALSKIEIETLALLEANGRALSEAQAFYNDTDRKLKSIRAEMERLLRGDVNPEK